MRIKLALLLLLTAATTPATATVVRYYHTDALGSPVAITDESGNILERREYEPFGAQLAPAVSDGPGYTGHVQDSSTGLVYMQQRYYDASIGRFISIDPVYADTAAGNNFNRYWYANNNPYRFTDPDGRLAHEDQPGQHTGAAYVGFAIIGMSVNSPTFRPIQSQKHGSARVGEAKKVAKLTNSQRVEAATQEVNKVRPLMEGVAHKSPDDAARTFYKFAQPISSRYRVEIESLITGLGSYSLTGTLVGNTFEYEGGVGYTTNGPSNGMITIHTHPMNTYPGLTTHYPFSGNDVHWNGSSTAQFHYVTTPDGIFRFDGKRQPVVEVKP